MKQFSIPVDRKGKLISDETTLNPAQAVFNCLINIHLYYGDHAERLLSRRTVLIPAEAVVNCAINNFYILQIMHRCVVNEYYETILNTEQVVFN